jgi:hypothetical protein
MAIGDAPDRAISLTPGAAPLPLKIIDSIVEVLAAAA